MHKVVELILKRMESHPEEFVDARMKQMIEPYRQYLTTEEKEALKAKERDIHLDTLHVRVMKQILAEKEVDLDAAQLLKAQQMHKQQLQQQIQNSRNALAQTSLGQAQLQGSQQGALMQSANGGVTWASQRQHVQRNWTNAGIHYMLNSNGQVFWSKDNTNWKEL